MLAALALMVFGAIDCPPFVSDLQVYRKRVKFVLVG